jgi:uncharacterized membrane protein
MLIYVLALLIGVIAGLRAMTAPAAASWGAYLGVLHVQDTALSFMAATVTPYILTALALAELVTDKLPKTPSRKVPMQFGTRLVTGAWAGATFGVAGGNLFLGLALGAIGAVVGTFGGAAMRGAFASAFGRDVPAALTEDLIALGGAVLILGSLA